MTKGKRVGVISLGCDKNRIDTEKMLFILSERHTLTKNPEDAQILIINTCAFLESSRKEAIEEILWGIELKNLGLEKLIVTGCLPQKFIGETFDALPEVDAFLGVSDYGQINEIIDRTYKGERVNAVGLPRGECGKKRVLTTNGYAYLKIADGCSNHCTYCLIPKIRGKFRSVPKDDLIEEVKGLGEIKELILVAQDLTKYGADLDGNVNLCSLIRELSKLDTVKGIRLLYCYPEGVSEELIKELKENPKLIKYIDIPFQHASDRVLKLMNRKGTFSSNLSLIERLRKEVLGIAIRSTFITGFPTESEEDFNTLLEFIKVAKLTNAGFFKYSREKDTPAYKLDGQVPARIKESRIRRLYTAQKKVVKEWTKNLVGKTVKVSVEGFDEEQLVYYGRAYFNAPDVDGKVYFFSQEEVELSEEINVRIKKAFDYDLYGDRV